MIGAPALEKDRLREVVMLRSRILSTVLASAVIGVLAVTPSAFVSAQETPKVSPSLAKPLKAANDAVQAKKYNDALTKLKDVDAMSGKSAYDQHLINELLGFVYVRTQKYPEAIKYLEPGLDDGFLKKSQVPQRVRQLLTLSYQTKNYDKVLTFGDRAIKGGYADDDIYTWMGQAYFLKGNNKEAAKFVERYVDGQVKAGKKPKEQSLLLIQSACNKADDSACVQRSFERLVTYYPKTEYWQNLVGSMYKQQSAQTDEMLLQVYRLAAAVDVLKRPEEYTEFAQLAMDKGSPGEAQAILEKGLKDQVFKDTRSLDKNKRLLESAKKQVAANRAALAKTDAEAAADATGAKDVNVGLAYIGYREYDKAIEALQRGIKKPGLKNPAEARLLLGIAELNAGKKDEAKKTFKSVKGDPQIEKLANLWSLHTEA
jgi:TolA-binding protein